MKKVWLIIFAALFFAPLPMYAAERNVNASSLSVFNFNATTLDASRYGTEVTNMLTEALGKNKAFSIISRHDLQEFLRLNDLQQNDNLENLINIGSRLGLNFIVTGRIEKKGVTLVVECFVVNIRDEKVIFNSKYQALGDSNLASEVNKMSNSIVAAITTGTRTQGNQFPQIGMSNKKTRNIWCVLMVNMKVMYRCGKPRDCFVAWLLAMTGSEFFST